MYHDITFPGNLSTLSNYLSVSSKVPWHYISGQSLHQGQIVIFLFTKYHDITFPGNLSTRVWWFTWHCSAYHDITFPGNLSTNRDGIFCCGGGTMTLHFRAISPLMKIRSINYEREVPWHYISGQSLHEYGLEIFQGFYRYRDITFPGNLSTKQLAHTNSKL